MANAASRIAPALASALPVSDAFAQITLPAHEFHPHAIHEQAAWKRNLVILTTWEARLQAVTLIMLCPFVPFMLLTSARFGRIFQLKEKEINVPANEAG
jgi:hypothetical protein